MNLLAIETATEHCSVGLSAGGQVTVRERLAPREHGRLLLPWIDELLAEAGMGYGDLDAMAVDRGPGGFTSLRLGMSVAQGIALAHGLPLHPVSSLAALALAAADRAAGRPVLACLDARMGEVYAGLYAVSGATVKPLAGERVVAPDALEVPGDGALFGAGSGFGAYGEVLRRRLGDRLEATDPDVWPGARELLRLADSVESLSAAKLEPVYLRDRVAEPPQAS